MENAVTEATPPSGSLREAAQAFAGLLSGKPGDGTPREQQPEPGSEDTNSQLAPAAPEGGDTQESESATDEGAEASESAQPETPKTYKAKVDGQEVEVTLEEALKGYSRTADYLRKTEALANQRKEFEEKELSAVRQERQQYGEYLAKWVDVLKANTPIEPDPSQMEPGAFAIEWVKWKQHNDHVAQAQAEQARVRSLQEADAEKGFHEYVRSEQVKLAEAIPAFSDPEQSKTLKADLIAYAKTRGFTDSDFDTVTDHRLVLLLHDAMQGQKAKAKAPEIKQRIDKVLESPRPGANNQLAKPDDVKTAMKRLRESGRVEDAAAAFAARFK